MPAGERPGVVLAVQARVSPSEVGALAAEAERLGFARLLVPDHPATTSDPFVVLAAAASATTRIGLGTYVLNVGIREPWQVASAAATLDALSGGRMHLGVGAGHAPAEWRLAGREPGSPGTRVDRLVEFVAVIGRLLAGDAVSFHGDHFRLDEAQLPALSPSRGSIPLIIGGNGPRVLRLAGAAADIVSLTGFGRTLPDGHSHEVRWARHALERRLADVLDGAAGRPQPPLLEALVQHLEVTEDRIAAAERLVAEGVPGLTLDSVLDTPFALFGTIEEIAGQMRQWHEDLGIRSFVVRPDAMQAGARVARVLR